ncbi:AzlC family ABC transporter permease [Oceanidesulfovibrio marinus]|uniref:AzlC family ABC transporter permease n=1 Tax=Oceanidesulfovibrio marinus TaxID=370038 RepID=A0ABX6NK08_9BACT|nr:AzlC family ABC transporter permease [Oceanidesulfovibrio marinus]QJT10918.1 AzlC family ABC transporter permease [Oceanidesulfovibrio marinus]
MENEPTDAPLERGAYAAPARDSISWAGAFSLTLPIILGYVPVGFAYGVLAREHGLDPVNTILMSVIVFAGSAQLIAVGLLGAGATAFSVIATTFVVNLRHMLMSAALGPRFTRWPKGRIALFTFQLTDETFALHASRFAGNPAAADDIPGITRCNMLAQFSWVAGTVLGVVASDLISNTGRVGLDFALPAMFIALLVAQIRDRMHVAVALLSGGLSLFFFDVGLTRWNVMAATVLGALAGLVLSQLRREE